MTRGFGLIELLVALAIVALLWGGAKYLKQYQTETGSVLSGASEAKRQAEEAKRLIEGRY
ncbi:MAG: prepilin-type N-terminal cleavage/methylation domain-containing protein [Patescibacteria group bacterium]